MVELCTTAKKSISEMTGRFDGPEQLLVGSSNSAVSIWDRSNESPFQDQFGNATEQLVEFATAINEVFKTVTNSLNKTTLPFIGLFIDR
jgi:hypothetical protein